MAYDLAKVTANGNNLIAQILANKSSLSVDKIEISDTQLSSTTDISTMTSVPKVVQTVSANGFSKNSNTLIISTVVDNSSIRADYKAWVFGIWGSDSQNGQSQLIAVITSTNSPDTIPAFSGRTPVSYTYKFNIGFSNASQIKFNMIDDSFATNDTVVHTTGDETIDGQKKFKTDPTDSAGNAYAKTVDVNQQLDKKVNIADMRKPANDVAGIEEVSTLQTQVDNSAVGTNLVAQSDLKGGYLDTDTGGITPASTADFHVDSYIPTNGSTVFTFSSPDYVFKGNMNCTLAMYDSNKKYLAHQSITTATQTLSNPNTAYIRFSINFVMEGGTAGGLSDWLSAHRYKLEKGSVATDWCPNPDDKVNIADMRKPASDVVGLEDVPNGLYKGSLAQNTDLNNLTQEGIYDFGTSLVNFIDSDSHWGTIQVTNKSAVVFQYVICTSRAGNQIYFRMQSGIPATWVPWTMVSAFGMDNRLTLPNGELITPADDSKVSHLSGANNFDTVPTVNNNPLLLASSLPSDLARTGSDQEFTGKNTFDVAPIDKTTGNPYITAKAPGIPKLAVTYNATSKAFDYTLTAPEKDGLSDIIQYNLLWKDHSVDDWTTVIVKPDALTGQITGVDTTKTYDFKAAAQNAVGSSDFTDVITMPTVDDNIYGVSWDGSSSGTLQRTDAAVGLKAGINGAQNDFDTRGPWELMDKTVTDSYGNAFVRVPKFYIRKTQYKSKPLSTWQVSLVKQGDDWYLPNCFYDFDNKKELDYVDVSRYEGFIESGHLKSKSGVNPTNSVDINDFRTAATALNVDGKKGYHLWDVHTLDALQVLFTIEFATLDSQSIMKGVTDDVLSGTEATGAADGVKGSSGNVNHSNGYGSMTYRGIENLYGNLATWTDGLNISNLSLYSCDDATKYASDVFTSPYYMLKYSLQSMTSGNSNITGLGFDKDHPSVAAPTSSNNDQYNTYYHDYCYVNGSGNYVVYTGGSWSWGAGGSGLWFWCGGGSWTYVDSNVGSRLLKKAL